MKENKNISKVLWGLLLIIAAIYIIVSRYTGFPRINVFKLLLTILFVFMIIEGMRTIDFYKILLPAACICIIYDKYLRITAITPWPVLCAALLASIGLTMLFGKKEKQHIEFKVKSKIIQENSNNHINGENIMLRNSFGSTIKYINSDNFCFAEIENSFGSMAVYFDNANIKNNFANINIYNNFGETKLFIPKEWHIQNNLEHFFGTVNKYGIPSGTSDIVLDIKGQTSFGAISIYLV